LNRFNLKLIVTLAIAFVALALAARALGGTQPPNPALRGFVEGCEDKPQPCWYGIVPGVTTMQNAIQAMPDQVYSQINEGVLPFGGSGYYSNYHSTSSNCVISIRHYVNGDSQQMIKTDTVDEIMISDCQSLVLSDLIDVIGDPEGIQTGSTRMGGQAMVIMNNASTLVGTIDFSSPSVAVNTLFIFPTETFATAPQNWHGFQTIESYCHFDDVIFPPCKCQPCLP
jgi:hypothetical protein